MTPVWVVVVTGWLAAVALVFFGSLWLGFHLDHQACNQEGRTLGVQTQYHNLSGCYLQINGRWLQDSQYIVNNPTK